MLNTKNPAWSPRYYRQGDEKGIFELWKAVYPDREYDYESWFRWWKWLNIDNPAGRSWICLAEDGNKVVGQSVIIPARIKYREKIITAFQATNTMTHPDYRRQGMYETLARKVFAEAAKNGVYVGYRFPNENSHPVAVNKLNWFDAGIIRYSIKPLNWENTLRTITENRLLGYAGATCGKAVYGIIDWLHRDSKLSGFNVEKISSFDDSLDAFWNGLPDKSPLMVVRYRDYLNWKYIDCPASSYSVYTAQKENFIEGYIIFKTTVHNSLRSVSIMDFLANSKKIAGYLLERILDICRKDGVDYLHYSFIGNSTVVKALSRKGFIYLPSEKKWFCAYTASEDYSKNFLRDPHNWLVQIGDSDTL